MSPAQEQTKKCSKCGEIKGVGEFWSNKSKKDGYSTECKTCGRHYHEKYYSDNTNLVKNKNRAYYLSHQEELIYKQSEYSKEHREQINKYRKEKFYPGHKEDYSKYYFDNKDKIRNRRLQKKYGINIFEYNLLLNNQDYKCYICGCSSPGGKHKESKNFYVDHSHKNGKVRGLLCSRCNKAIGLFEDSPSLLRSAADYLEKWEKEE